MPETKEQSLTEILSSVVPIGVYRGVTVIKLIGGFEVLGKKCKTVSEVNKLIDEGLKAIEKSIVK